jgi:hypothetical protein
MKEKKELSKTRKSRSSAATGAKTSMKDARDAATPSRGKKMPAPVSDAPEKKPSRVKRQPTAPATPTADEVAVAAFLNWCHRRNQGLPADPVADWIAAECDMVLAR